MCFDFYQKLSRHAEKRQICPNCKTGEETYRLDPRGGCCPYFTELKVPKDPDGKFECSRFVPRDK